MMSDVIVITVQPGSAQCFERSRVNGSQSLKYGTVFPEYDYHYSMLFFRSSIPLILSNTQYFAGGDTMHTKQYAVFSGVDPKEGIVAYKVKRTISILSVY